MTALGLHDDQGALPAGPQARQGHPECAVGLSQPRSLRPTLQDGELLPQGEVLQRKDVLRFQAGSGGREERAEQLE